MSIDARAWRTEAGVEGSINTFPKACSRWSRKAVAREQNVSWNCLRLIPLSPASASTTASFAENGNSTCAFQTEMSSTGIIASATIFAWDVGSAAVDINSLSVAVRAGATEGRDGGAGRDVDDAVAALATRAACFFRLTSIIPGGSVVSSA